MITYPSQGHLSLSVLPVFFGSNYSSFHTATAICHLPVKVFENRNPESLLGYIDMPFFLTLLCMLNCIIQKLEDAAAYSACGNFIKKNGYKNCVMSEKKPCMLKRNRRHLEERCCHSVRASVCFAAQQQPLTSLIKREKRKAPGQ